MGLRLGLGGRLGGVDVVGGFFLDSGSGLGVVCTPRVLRVVGHSLLWRVDGRLGYRRLDLYVFLGVDVVVVEGLLVRVHCRLLSVVCGFEMSSVQGSWVGIKMACDNAISYTLEVFEDVE